VSCLRQGIFLRGTFGSHDYQMTPPVLVMCPAGVPWYQSIKCCTKCGDTETVWLGRPPEAEACL